MTDKPHFVFRDGMTADRDYVRWITDIKSRYRNSQIKAAIKVNSALLEFYWSVGRDLAVLKAEERWGSGIVKQLVPSQPSFSRLGIVLTLSDLPSALGLSKTFALDMRNAFPEAKGFSDTNVKYMKRWYMFYYEQIIKCHQAGDQIDVTERSRQLADQLELRMDDETTFFPDLVYYPIPQKRYVIIELKAVKFEPEYAGKLNFYVTSADKLLKGDGDNESVGLIICKTAKKNNRGMVIARHSQTVRCSHLPAGRGGSPHHSRTRAEKGDH